MLYGTSIVNMQMEIHGDLEAAERQGDDGNLINDLRAFNVVFA